MTYDKFSGFVGDVCFVDGMDDVYRAENPEPGYRMVCVDILGVISRFRDLCNGEISSTSIRSIDLRKARAVFLRAKRRTRRVIDRTDRRSKEEKIAMTGVGIWLLIIGILMVINLVLIHA